MERKETVFLHDHVATINQGCDGALRALPHPLLVYCAAHPRAQSRMDRGEIRLEVFPACGVEREE